MITPALVFIWGKLAGAVAWDDRNRLGSFEYDPAFQKLNYDLSPLMMPPIVLLIPVLFMAREVHLTDTVLALVLGLAVVSKPLSQSLVPPSLVALVFVRLARRAAVSDARRAHYTPLATSATMASVDELASEVSGVEVAKLRTRLRRPATLRRPRRDDR
mgnify:CR=1 FL=1